MFQRDWLANNMMVGGKLTFNSEKQKILKDYVVGGFSSILFYVFFFPNFVSIRNQSDIFLGFSGKNCFHVGRLYNRM